MGESMALLESRMETFAIAHLSCVRTRGTRSILSLRGSMGNTLISVQHIPLSLTLAERWEVNQDF